MLAVLPGHLTMPVAVIAGCGLRVGEVLALRRCDVIDEANGMWLAVERTLRLIPPGSASTGPLKDSDPYEVAVSEALAARLCDHLTSTDGQPGDPLFTTPDGGRWSTALYLLRHVYVG